MVRNWLAVALVAWIAPSVVADIINVPGDYPTIQAAINAAQNGDEIMVAPGTYHELVDLLDKAITVRSSKGPTVTIIDATGLGGNAVKCVGCGAPTVEGFTITGGSGGGVHAVGGVLELAACIVTSNGGGGVYSSNATLMLTDCTLSYNLPGPAVTTSFNTGGVVMTNCQVPRLPAKFGEQDMTCRWRTSIAVALALTNWSQLAPAAPGPNRPGAVDYADVVAMLKSEIPKLLADNRVPGAAVALVDDQQLVFVSGFGVTESGKSQPVVDDTIFSVQSVSKTYTATAFLIAVDHGLLRLDDSVRSVWPGFSARTRGFGDIDRITSRQLLCHMAGLCHEAPIGNNYGEWRCSFDEHVQSIADTWLKCRSGERFRYSNLGYDVAAFLLQLRSGTPFHEHMRSALLVPLGMINSTFDQRVALGSANLARGHIAGKPVPPLEIPMLGAGGMYSSVRDMGRFVAFQLADGAVGGNRLLRAETLAEMTHPQSAGVGNRAGYGLGVNVRPFHGCTLVSHGGGGYGYSAEQRWIPESKLGIVVLTNGEEGDAFVQDLADRTVCAMIRAKLGHLPTEDSMPWMSEQTFKSSPEELERFDGIYMVGMQTKSFRADDDGLRLVSGDKSTALEQLGPTRFRDATDLYEFVLDEAGRPVEVQHSTRAGKSVLVFAESPRDVSGPDLRRWAAYMGTYQAMAYGRDDERELRLRDGFLRWGRRFRLSEASPGLFFTADGDSVEMTEDGLRWANRRYTQVKESAASLPAISPGATWSRIEDPHQLGWSVPKLERAKQYADFIDTAAVMLIVRGQILYSWGDTTTKFMSHSMRKSLLNGLYGIFEAEGRLDLSKTLGDMGIDDQPTPLSEAEKKATILDLVRSRSGVYHPAALETPDMALGRPARGSHSPGSFWWYNNWDFNVLGTVFEWETGAKIFEAFKERIGDPIGMEDFVLADGSYIKGPESVHAGYPFRLSTRDLARYGLLFLRRGAWNGRQLIPAQWVSESTAPHSDTGTGGYAYMWWAACDGKGVPGVTLPDGTFWAWGTRGHYVLVVPNLDLVVVHRVNTDEYGREVTHKEFGRLLKLILESHEGTQ